MRSSELDMMLSLGSLGMLLVDPNSTTGLRYEGFCARQTGKGRDANPFSVPKFKGCLAEGHWWEGWDACDKRLASVDRSPEGGDAKQGSIGDESAVPARADATPSPSQSESSHDSI